MGNKCFQFAATVVLNYKEIGPHTERVSNIKLLVNECNWKRINYPSKIDDLKTFEENNLAIALNILYTKEKEIRTAYISKTYLNCEKKKILLMIPNKEKEGWHYLAVKNCLHYYEK